MANGLANGLEGVVAAETVLSYTDPARGMTWIRGHSLPDLVANHGFEGTVALLWDGFVDKTPTRAGIQADLGAARVAAFAGLGSWLDRARARPMFEAVRIGLASLPDSATPAAIVGAMTVIVAALLRTGQDPIPPDPTLSTAADLLRMHRGTPASPEAAKALDTYIAVMSESGLNTSAFAARVVASSRASLTDAVLGAWCAFTGPIHGGAPGPTLDMLDAAEKAPDLDAWLEQKLRSGERLMGFGHRVYHGNDPRAEAMRQALLAMGPAAGRLPFAAHVESRVAAVVERVKPGRRLPPNVEIMAALLLEAVGFPREGFTPVFAVGRCPGWIAHALEQRKTGRLFRPASRYVGSPI